MKKKIWGAIIFLLLFCVVFFFKGNGMSVFNKQVWSASDFESLMKDETMIDVYRPLAKDVIGRVGIELILPAPSFRMATVQLSSNRLYDKPQSNIYIGPYKAIIVLDVDQAFLGDGSSKYDGYDSLEITFIDEVNRVTYTCVQEKSFHMWQLNKTVTINFLPQRKLDKNGEPYCYDAYIHRGLNF
ncbi:MAG: hypothetical protein ACRCZ4_09195 [Plesiomonas sp.]|uniref:hypothetical protein n=1 Tax=Plesiomonas sp. TaxID=2486279 RepID=UPI003F41762C